MKSLRLTIKATNGTIWETTAFHSNHQVHVVLKRAIQHFIKTGIMADGDYAMALVVGGRALELEEGSKLEDVGVIDGSVLAIIVRGPQVDGA